MKLWMIAATIKWRIFWRNRRKWLIILAIGLGALIVWAVVSAYTNSNWFYIDWDNNSGVAKKCWIDNGRLLCEKMYNGIIDVKQYWKG